MMDVLVALLLLAMVLTGTCTVLIQAVRASGDALRAARAADLAADLAEELRSATTATEAGAIVAAWRSRIPSVLPVSGLEPDELASLTASDPQGAEGATIPVAPLLLLRLRWLSVDNGPRELVLPIPGRAEGAP